MHLCLSFFPIFFSIFLFRCDDIVLIELVLLQNFPMKWIHHWMFLLGSVLLNIEDSSPLGHLHGIQKYIIFYFIID